LDNPSYTPEFEAAVQAWAEQRIKPKRLAHVRGVVAIVDHLARRYAPDEVMRVRLAGWIHDAAKHLPDTELLRLAEAHQLPITDSERRVPMLLHGAVGYALAAEAFGLDDPRLQTACAYHTTGAPGMNTADKIVFLGDLIEPTRDFPGVEALRAQADHDLDAAVLMAVDYTLRYIIDRRRYMDPRPVLLRNELLVAGVNYAET
jgi:predicted HD superfamily hydrolase involved in NAD metabolism